MIAGHIFIHSEFESNVFLLATSALAAQATFRLCSRQSADSDGLPLTVFPEGRSGNVLRVNARSKTAEKLWHSEKVVNLHVLDFWL